MTFEASFALRRLLGGGFASLANGALQFAKLRLGDFSVARRRRQRLLEVLRHARGGDARRFEFRGRASIRLPKCVVRAFERLARRRLGGELFVRARLRRLRRRAKPNNLIRQFARARVTGRLHVARGRLMFAERRLRALPRGAFVRQSSLESVGVGAKRREF